MTSSMHLCLVNNDPTSTVLVSENGEPMFSIETRHLPDSGPTGSSNPYANTPGYPNSISHPSNSNTSSHPPRQRSPTTSVLRLERFQRSTGHVETEIGVVEYRGPHEGTSVRMGGDSKEARLDVNIAPCTRNTQVTDGSEGDEEPLDSSWAFEGPDSTPYKWQLFCQSPILTTADSSVTPLARYRRAKLGIVSRSRRAFLEILPAGLGIIDLIVVTFVGFMKQRVMIDAGQMNAARSVGAIHEGFVGAARALAYQEAKGPHVQGHGPTFAAYGHMGSSSLK